MPMLQDLPPMMNMGCVPQDIDDDVFSELARMGADDCGRGCGPMPRLELHNIVHSYLPPPRPGGIQRG